jgi:hypothetical protein
MGMTDIEIQELENLLYYKFEKKKIPTPAGIIVFSIPCKMDKRNWVVVGETPKDKQQTTKKFTCKKGSGTVNSHSTKIQNILYLTARIITCISTEMNSR